jgi:D-threonine aldolase
MNNIILNINEIDSPALIVFPEIVKQNIEKAITIIGDTARLRPHIKTHKTLDVIKLCQAAGIQKYKCATIAEAELLGIALAKDVLLAYQPIGPKAFRFQNIIEKYPNTNFSCVVDSLEIAQFYAKNQLNFNLYIDLNVGMNRTGIAPELATELALAIGKLPMLKLIGLHAYDGHIHNIDFEKRKTESDIAYSQIEKLISDLANINLNGLNIIMGGSPTYPIHAKRKNIECSPGTFVFWDKGYADICPEQPFIPAINIVSRIISKPSETKICIDLGYKSVASENELKRRVYFPNNPDLQIISQSEEHLVLDAAPNNQYKIGDLLLSIPIHICPTVALYEHMHVVENERITGNKWNILARNRQINC